MRSGVLKLWGPGFQPDGAPLTARYSVPKIPGVQAAAGALSSLSVDERCQEAKRRGKLVGFLLPL